MKLLAHTNIWVRDSEVVVLCCRYQYNWRDMLRERISIACKSYDLQRIQQCEADSVDTIRASA